MWLIISKILSPFLALIIGTLCWKKMDLFFRLFCVQVGCTVLFYFISRQILVYQKANHITLNNQWLFNISLLIEAALFLFALNMRRGFKSITILTVIIGILIIGSFTMEISRNTFFTYASTTDAFMSMLFVILFGLFLFLELNSQATAWYKQPVVWLCVGLLTYYACSVPYFSVFEYLQKHSSEENENLFKIINGILSNIRYLCLAAAFWLLYRNPKSFNSNSESNVL